MHIGHRAACSARGSARRGARVDAAPFPRPRARRARVRRRRPSRAAVASSLRARRVAIVVRRASPATRPSFAPRASRVAPSRRGVRGRIASRLSSNARSTPLGARRSVAPSYKARSKPIRARGRRAFVLNDAFVSSSTVRDARRRAFVTNVDGSMPIRRRVRDVAAGS